MAYKAFLTGNEAGSLVKSMRNARPVFLGYDMVKVEAQLRAREEGKSAELAAAFADNLGYLVEQDAGIAGGSLKVCRESACSGKIITVRFEEEGYGSNSAAKFVMGDLVKGKLVFVDQGTGTVLHEAPHAATDNYAKLLKQIHGILGYSVIKTEMDRTPKDDSSKFDARLKKLNAAFERIQPIKPGYSEIFEKG